MCVVETIRLTRYVVLYKLHYVPTRTEVIENILNIVLKIYFLHTYQGIFISYTLNNFVALFTNNLTENEKFFQFSVVYIM